MDRKHGTIFFIASLTLCLCSSAAPAAFSLEGSKKTASASTATVGSTSNSSIIAKAWTELKNKNYRSALKAADLWLVQEPHAAGAYFVKGKALCELNQKDRAMEAMTTAIKYDPKLDGAYGERAWMLYSARRYREAERDYSSLIAINPCALAYTGRACVNEKMGRTKAVIADCTKSIQLNPKDLTAYELRANAFYKAGPYESCIEDWKKAISLDPKAERLRLGLGFALSKTYDHEAVVEEMTRAINSGVKTLEIYKIRADAFYKQENYKRSAEDLTIILTNFHNIERWKRWDYFKLRARAYLRNNEYAKAEKDSTEALAIAPDDTKSYYCRADARQHLGKFKEAIQDLTLMIKFDPNDGKAFSMRAKIYEHIGEKAKADSDRKAAIKLGEKQWGI